MDDTNLIRKFAVEATPEYWRGFHAWKKIAQGRAASFSDLKGALLVRFGDRALERAAA